jgi:hypothetical protein
MLLGAVRMQYYFNNLNATSFQRLINSILVARFGEDIRLTPLYGADGGRDGETAPGNPYFDCEIRAETSFPKGQITPPRQGRYLFQVKHHRTVDARLSEARRVVIADFERELQRNVMGRVGAGRVNYFFLVTNVPSSKNALAKLDKKRTVLLQGIANLHADVWWQEQIMAYLDQMPVLWNGFPKMFAGNKVPLLAEVARTSPGTLPRAVRIALGNQYEREVNVKFRQIDLEKSLFKLFVDLDVTSQYLAPEEQRELLLAEMYQGLPDEPIQKRDDSIFSGHRYMPFEREHLVSAIGVLLNEREALTRKIVLEGGPGQGKSTLTQMAAQIYRQRILDIENIDPEERWRPPSKVRLPFRIELRNYAEHLSNDAEFSIEQYIATIIKRDSGGSTVNVDDIHTLAESSPIILFLDGLDEVGSDELRDHVLDKIGECIQRLEKILHVDLRVIVTTRPPAMAGRRDRLVDFRRLPLAPLEPLKVKAYVDRWLSIQLQDEYERQQIRASFESRQREPHVQALVKNPMQLSVLLHFIRLKGEAFPDRRAELYRDYFRTVIDRDVEKSAELRKQRELIETLHQFLGYKIHALTEAQQADGTLSRNQLLQLVEEWLRAQGNQIKTADELFKLGEERLGLIVALKGEGGEASYGYEIQPIREYFAAAFINDQIRGDAHAIFQTMVRRPYWREVALFLAGLRRPNEKADLVVRAKHLDSDDEWGWRQDGRAVTLQLLQEGAFSQPQHVFSEALDFVLDLLDPEIVVASNEPKGVVDVLPVLLKQDEAHRHRIRLLNLLKRFRQCDDEHIIWRLHRIASRVFDATIAREHLLSQCSQFPDIMVKARLVWPLSWGIDMREASKQESYWQVAPDHIWAEQWWQTALHSNLATTLEAPSTVHQRLIEQFASSPFFLTERIYPNRFSLLTPLSKWAVWRLAMYKQMLLVMQIHEALPEEAAELIRAQSLSEIDYSGLDDSCYKTVHDLIAASQSILQSIISGGSSILNTFLDYIPTLREHLKQPGISGWLTCRSSFVLLITFVAFKMNQLRRTARMRDVRFSDLIEDQEALMSLWADVSRFYYEPKQGGSGVNLQQIGDPDLLLRGVYGHFPDLMPKYIRLKEGGDYVAISDLLSKHISTGKELPLPWLKTVSFSTDIIRPLVDKCSIKHLPRLLTELSKWRFIPISTGRPLLTQHVHRILKITRTTDDVAILEGALITLSTSRFLHIADIDLLIKMIRAGQTKLNFSSQIFRRRYEPTGNTDSKDAKLLYGLAREVVRSPKDYSVWTVSSAAEYLAENTSINLPPILREEEDLGLQVHS